MANVIRKTTKEVLGQLGTSYICDDIGCCSWYNAKDVDAQIRELNAKLTIANATVAKLTIEARDKDGLIKLVREQRNAAWVEHDEKKQEIDRLNERSREDWQLFSDITTNLRVILGAKENESLTDTAHTVAHERSSYKAIVREIRIALGYINETPGIELIAKAAALRNALFNIKARCGKWWNLPAHGTAQQELGETISLVCDISDEYNAALNNQPTTGATPSGSSR